MKFNTIIKYFGLFVFLLLLNCVNSLNKSNLKKYKLKNNSKNSKHVEVIGASYSGNDNKQSIAVSSAEGIVKNTPSSLSNYKNVQIVNKLQDNVVSPPKGPLESVEEIPTLVNYYDGDLKLNSININCNVNNSVYDCLKYSYCNWCSSNSNCMLANSMANNSCPRSMVIRNLQP